MKNFPHMDDLLQPQILVAFMLFPMYLFFLSPYLQSFMIFTLFLLKYVNYFLYLRLHTMLKIFVSKMHW